MKNLLFAAKICLALLLSLSNSVNSIAQIDCYTPEPSETDYYNIPWYGDENGYTSLHRMYDSLIQLYGGSSQFRVLGESDLLRVPVKFYIYQRAAGDPGGTDSIPREDRLQFALDDINQSFKSNGIRMKFFILAVENKFHPDAVVMNSIVERTFYANLYFDAGAVNIHVVDAGGDVVELYAHPAAFVNRRVFTTPVRAKTFTHEVGHVFGLLHTHNFHNIPCLREPVSRGFLLSACTGIVPTKRCAYTGDLLCDTPADPNMQNVGVYDTTTCTWNGNGLTDSYG